MLCDGYHLTGLFYLGHVYLPPPLRARRRHPRCGTVTCDFLALYSGEKKPIAVMLPRHLLNCSAVLRLRGGVIARRKFTEGVAVVPGRYQPNSPNKPQGNKRDVDGPCNRAMPVPHVGSGVDQWQGRCGGCVHDHGSQTNALIESLRACPQARNPGLAPPSLPPTKMASPSGCPGMPP